MGNQGLNPLAKSAFDKPWGLHWFRRDLRVFNNLALKENFKKHQGRVLGVFCFDSEFLSRPDFSSNRFAFFLKSLVALKEEFKNQGGDLLVVNALPADFFTAFLDYLIQKQIKPFSSLSYNRDYEPFSQRRDKKINAFLIEKGIDLITDRDHLVLEPHEVLKDSNFTGSDHHSNSYKVYTPFAKKWFSLYQTSEVKKRLPDPMKLQTYFDNQGSKVSLSFNIDWKALSSDTHFPWPDSLNDFINHNQVSVSIPIPEAGFYNGIKRVLDFSEGIKNYKEQRDLPALPATSKLSLFFKNGSLTPSLVLSLLNLQKEEFMPQSGRAGENQFLREIVWREFYYSILFHFPFVENQSFLPQYRDLKWHNNQNWFQRWCEGTTGFPIVDAGMRELLSTGWMHNRVRMIVASFLTKDLLIDWRWGEKHFMKYLLDGDLAPNNGGWQWAASTGCDPQPYFRIFNPWLQSAKFDPGGDYIKTHIPALKAAPAAALHDPEFDRSRYGYPKPMVNHSEQKMKAIDLFKYSKA